jgi:hypothetical protein
MAALIIPNSTPFGGMTNQTVSGLLRLHTTVERLQDAIATASAGYTGVDGTQFEAQSMGMMPTGTYMGPNNFGVQPDPATPGKNGTDYAYAMNVLASAWATFWAAAEASINQLDNGGSY